MSARTHISRTEQATSPACSRAAFGAPSRLVDDEASNRAVNQAVVRAKQGDREALRFLYVRYADHVYGYVLEHRARRLRGRGRHAARVREADDQARRSTSRARCRSPRGSSASHATSPSTTSASAARSPARKSASCRCHGDDDGSARDRALDLRDALASLPEEQRQVVVMRHLVGPDPGRDRRPARPHRALDPRPAPPRPRRAAHRARRDGVRPRDQRRWRRDTHEHDD